MEVFDLIAIEAVACRNQEDSYRDRANVCGTIDMKSASATTVRN
jgi:hypothetical protein